MDFRLALFLLAICISTSFGKAVDIDEDENTKWPIPQNDGSFVWMTEEEAYATVTIDDEELLESGVIYHLYTPNNPTEPQVLPPGDILALGMSNFNANSPTKILVHGWVPPPMDTESVMAKLISAFVNDKEQNNNVIFVDWRYKAKVYNYVLARKRVPGVGREIARFVDMLHAFGGMSFEKLTLVGHSLGAHVVGFVGKNVEYGRVNTIIGLDPAMPLFRFKNPQHRLSATDAEYVETIHTNGAWLGFFHPIGQAAFYPNWGKAQPGCVKDYSGYCSHARCVDLYVEAVEMGQSNRFVPTECAQFGDLRTKRCFGGVDGVRMYDPRNIGRAKGVYFLPTRDAAPFGLGEKGVLKL